MIITCENCSVKFNLNDELVKPTGSKVRCSKCKHIFTAFPEQPEPMVVEESEMPAAVVVPPESESAPAAPADDGLNFADLEKMLQDDTLQDDTLEDDTLQDDTLGDDTLGDDTLGDSDLFGGAEMEISEAELDDDEDIELDLSGLDEMLASPDDTEELQGDLDVDLDLDADDGERTILNDLDENELDLDELDDLLGGESTTAAAGDAGQVAEFGEEDDLNLDVELEEAGELDDDFGLDLDLDGVTDQSEEAPSLESGEEATDDDGLELDFNDRRDDEIDDLDLGLELEPDSVAELAGETDDPDFILDIDEDVAGLTLDDATESTGEDYTLEADLLETKTVAGGDEDSDDIQLELDINESEVGKEAVSVNADAGLEEIDLAALEQTLEMELLTPDRGEADEDEELRLDDEDGEDGDDISLEVDDDNVDMDAIEEMLALDEDGTSGETTSADDLELEFELDEPMPGGETDREAESVVADAGVLEEDQIDVAGTVPEGVVDTPVREKKGPSKGLLIILILLLLLSGGVGGYIYLSSKGMLPAIDKLNIPYIGDMLKTTPPADTGKVEALQNTIKGDFAINNELGRLFVITGKVKNNSSKAHRAVRVKAELYSSGKRLSSTIIVNCGNMLSPEELITLDGETIENRLMNKFDANGQYIRITPGSQKEFMFVIPNLPEDLEEYKIMIAGSTPE